MINHFGVLPECFTDKCIVEFLGYSNPNKGGGITDVLTQIEKLQDRLPKIIGVVDDDKKKPPLFQLYEQIGEKSQLKLFQKKGKENYLIMFLPESEDWLLNLSKASDIMPLFDNASDLKNHIRTQRLNDLHDIKRWLNDIKAINPEPFQTFISWLSLVAPPDRDIFQNI